MNKIEFDNKSLCEDGETFEIANDLQSSVLNKENQEEVDELFDFSQLILDGSVGKSLA